MPRKAFLPTSEQRELVRTLSGVGTREVDICLLIKGETGKPIDEKTLRKHFRHELDEGCVQATAKVARTLFGFATDPKGGSSTVTAAIFWLKTRAGWKEIQGVELTGRGGAPVQHQNLSPDLSNLSDDELSNLEAIAAKLGQSAKPGADPGRTGPA